MLGECLVCWCVGICGRSGLFRAFYIQISPPTFSIKQRDVVNKVYVCVREREIERERDTHTHTLKIPDMLFESFIVEPCIDKSIISSNQLMHILLNVHKKLRGLSPRANYTDRAAAAGRRS